MISVAKIRLDPPKSTRLFKGIICDDISEFESHMPSQAVESRQQRSPDTVVVISSDGKGDRAVESLEAKAPVGGLCSRAEGPLRPRYDFRKAQDVKVTGTLILPS
jgi:hypothetical protein